MALEALRWGPRIGILIRDTACASLSPSPRMCRIASGGRNQGMGFRLFIEGLGR
jgi:hypothetical protein